jgi:tRNA pseudouridine55 synthase
MVMERAGNMRELCLVCQAKSSQAVPTRAGHGPTGLTGILNLNKPSGLTSHAVVERIRRASGIRRVGHAGTLDPAASGVLLVCLGQATRVSEYLMDSRKTYEAQIRLGITTDTGDAEGRVVHSISTIDSTRAQVERALSRFRGRISQVPPMYSALKREGKPLYELARQGIEVERVPRTVEIYNLGLTEWAPPSIRLFVECSRGTYVRVLATDLGETLQTGAHLEQLVRTASGHFSLEDATPLNEAERALSNAGWPGILHPVDEALLHFDALLADPEAEARIRHGQQVEGPEPLDTVLCRVYTHSGEFMALLQYDQESEKWQPRKVFNAHEASA